MSRSYVVGTSSRLIARWGHVNASGHLTLVHSRALRFGFPVCMRACPFVCPSSTFVRLSFVFVTYAWWVAPAPVWARAREKESRTQKERKKNTAEVARTREREKNEDKEDMIKREKNKRKERGLSRSKRRSVRGRLTDCSRFLHT